jgi:hypothetical protein
MINTIMQIPVEKRKKIREKMNNQIVLLKKYKETINKPIDDKIKVTKKFLNNEIGIEQYVLTIENITKRTEQ